MLSRAIDFFNDEVYELRDGEFIRIDAPTDATVSVHRNWLLIELRTDWYRDEPAITAGSLLAADYDEFLAGTAELQVVFEPDEHTSLHHYAWTRDKLIVVTLADVASRVEVVTPGTWPAEPVPGIPDNTNTVIVATDELGDEIFLDSSGFDTPSRLLYGTAGGQLEEIKSAPSFFDAEDLTVTQHFATSNDGTAIPYFVVGHRHTRPRGRRCWAATAVSRCRGHRAMTVCWAGCGWPAAEPMCWPTFAAAASTARVGTPRRCGRAGTWWRRTSPRSQRIW